MNIQRGCKLGGLSYEVWGSFFVVWLLEVILLFILLFRKTAKSNQAHDGAGRAGPDDDLAMQPLADAFEIGDDDEHGDSDDDDLKKGALKSS